MEKEKAPYTFNSWALHAAWHVFGMHITKDRSDQYWKSLEVFLTLFNIFWRLFSALSVQRVSFTIPGVEKRDA